MSEIARRVVPLVGYAVGGLPGYVFGTIIGGLLFPPESKKRPTNIADIKLSGPARGAPLPILFGMGKLRGNLIWAGPVTVHDPGAGGKKGGGGKGLQAGKGGAEGQTVTYSRSVAYALCESDDAGFLALRKIWAGDDLLYDVDDPAVQQASGIDFTFYKGTQTVADPRLAAFQAGGTGTTKRTITEQTTINGAGPTYTAGTKPFVLNSDKVWSAQDERVIYFTRVGATPLQNQYTVNNTTGLFTFGGSYTNVVISVQYEVVTQTSSQVAIVYPHVSYIYFHEFNTGPSPALPNFQFELTRIPGGSASDNFNRADGAVGGGWSGVGSPIFLIETNALKIRNQAADAGAIRYTAVSPWGNDHYSQAKITALDPNSFSGPGVRIHATLRQGYGFARVDQLNGTTTLRIIRDGSASLVIAFVIVVTGSADDWGIGKIVSLEVQGTTLRARVDNKVVLTGTDATYTSGSPGFFSVGGISGSFIKYDDWQAAALGNGVFDVSPVNIIEDLITHTRYGASLATSIIDVTTRDALRDFCFNNDLLVSAVIENPASALAHIEQILSHYFGWMGYVSGKITFGARRVETTTRTIVRDDMLKDAAAVVSMPGVRDTKNMVRVDWIDRSNRYTPSQKYVSDDFDRVKTGVRLEALALPYCTRKELASKLASQYLYLRAVPQMGVTMTLGPKELSLMPGDVVALTDAALGLTQQTVRIASIGESEDRGEFRIEMYEEPAAVINLSQFPTESIQPGDPPPPPTRDPGPTLVQIIELPAELTGSAVKVGFALAGSSQEWAGASIYMSRDGLTYTRVRQYIGNSFIIGALQEAVVDTIDRRLLLPEDGEFDFDVDISAAPGDGLVGTDRNGLVAGQTLAAFAKEFMSYRTVTLVSGQRYTLKGFLRGWMDSGPLALVANDRFVPLRADLPVLSFIPDQIGTTFKFKFPSLNQAGVEQDIAGLPVYSFTLVGLGRQADPVYGLQVVEGGVRAGSKPIIGSGQIDVTAGWLYAMYGNPENADLVDGLEVAGKEPDFLDYIVKISSKATAGASYTLRRTVTGVTAESHTYTSAQNIADAGTYQRFVKFEVQVRRKHGAVSPIKPVEVEVAL